MLTVGSCFAGIGGLDLGLERAGMSVRWQVEIDEFCRRVLAKHWPDVRRHDDINTAPDADLEPVDLICGGVPCQPWSVAGKRKGNDDARDLWPAFWRLCLLLRPRYVVVEEVPGFAVDGGLGRALTDIARAGYAAEWFHLSAAEVGSWHLRKRLWIVANADGNGQHGQDLHLRSGRQDEAEAFGVWTGEAADADGSGLANGHESVLRESELGIAVGGGWWSSEPSVGRVVHGLPRGLAGWRRASISALGNAVVPQVAEVIGRRIVEHVRSSHAPQVES